jgi:hypothetical protein
MVYFISEAKIKEMCNDNIESELIRTSLTNVQTIELKTIIGDSLYNTIEKIIINDLVVEPYTTLLTSYIHPYLQYAVLAELVIPSTYKIGSIGLNQAYTDSVNTTTKSDAQYVRKYYTDKAAFMEQRLTEYLEQNRNIFVDYDNYKDITKSRSTTSQSGLFLGGARNGNRSTDTHPTFIHDNTIRAYIRYDEPQALTTDQQAQAKRNIGIENINFDDIYTKDDIDRNYYTKQQTDTAIANIDIPTKTSDLTLDNVYSKEEVNDLVANSGGSDSNTNIVDILSLTYEEQLELINYVIDNNVFPDINTLYTYRGYILNNLKSESGWWEESLGQKIITFTYYAHPKSYHIRFITSDDGWGKIYNDFYELDESENLVTKGELLGFSYNDLNDKPIVDIMLLRNEEKIQIINYVIEYNRFPDINTLYTYRGYILNNLNFWFDWENEELNQRYIAFSLYGYPKSYEIRFITNYPSWGYVYNDMIEKEEIENLVKKGDLEQTIGNINNILEQI